MFSPRLNRLFQLSLILYVAFSVLYTTHKLLHSPCALCHPLSFLRLFCRRTPDPAPTPEHWNISQLVLDSSLTRELSGSSEPLLSKAFSHSMRPSRIIPFYYRASGAFDPEDITITTLITGNRFSVFSSLVSQYSGPISVTVHIPSAHPNSTALLAALHNMYLSKPSMAERVDVHLVLDAFPRQFNTWRNVARVYARTEFVMMLDVDFMPCTDFRAAMNEGVLRRLRGGRMALVVPAFEYVSAEEGKERGLFPRDKKELLSLVKAKRIGMFHPSWPPGHNSTDYARYYASLPGSIYKVTEYNPSYEPYIIFPRDGPPWCDERFVGYGGNKAACLFEVYLSGVEFFVLADHFVVHQNHLYQESVRRNERKVNRKVYADFKEELCLRYLKSYHASGILNTARGRNVREECKRATPRSGSMGRMKIIESLAGR